MLLLLLTQFYFFFQSFSDEVNLKSTILHDY